jgi:hypothetical protein
MRGVRDMMGMNPTRSGVSSPVHIVFLVDVSESMYAPVGHTTGIDIAYAVVAATVAGLGAHAASARGASGVSPQIKVALILYDEVAQDPFDGFRDVASLRATHGGTVGLPVPTTRRRRTDTLGGFTQALDLVGHVGPDAPPPLICHLTDGFVTQYTGDNPQTLPENLWGMLCRHGAAARRARFAHVVVGDQMLRRPIRDIRAWPGVLWEYDLHPRALAGLYARILFRMSSLVPEEAYPTVSRAGYATLSRGARLLLPGAHPHLVQTILVATAGASAHDAPDK